MNKNLGIGILILCFSLSSVNAGLASQVIDIPPVIVQPYDVSDLRAIDQQILEQDRINRDQELAIRGLIDDNQKLTDTTRKQDASIEKINHTMMNYRDFLLSRDRMRIVAYNQKLSKYYDLIRLTEDVDDMKGVGETLLLKRNVIEEKYKILTDLKDEMMALNDKLQGKIPYENFGKGLPKEDKIQMLIQRLKEMDRRVARYDEILAEKNRQIAQLKNSLGRTQSEAATKDEIIKQQENQIAVLEGYFKGKIPLSAGNMELPPLIVNAANQQPPVDLGDKDETIRWLNLVLAALRYKAEYYQLTSEIDQISMKQVQEQVQNIKDNFSRNFKDYEQFENAIGSLKDRVRLAKRLIDLQKQETDLLEEKDNLEKAQNIVFDRHARDLENKIKETVTNHHAQTVDLQNHMQELKNQLSQKVEQVELLKSELENKITEVKNQGALTEQVRNLKSQLQDREDQIAALKTRLKAGQKTIAEADALKERLATEQDRAEQLKQQLSSKAAESDKMTAMLGDYQKKLESKDNAYNEGLRQVLASKNYQAQMEKQIALLNSQLQQKEAQIVLLKKDMYDLQESANTKDMEVQSKDLSLSMVQQKMMEKKINEYQDKINGLQATNARQAQEITDLRADLALAREELKGMPSSDELEFLRTGLKKATLELKQKDEMLSQVKAHADEYEKEFKKQSKEFQSLKEQLQDANDQINRKNEDLKYKNMEVVRLKERSAVTEGDLKDQIKALTLKLDAAEKKRMGKTHGDKAEALQAQLRSAELQIKELKDKVDQLKLVSQNDVAAQKLKQALDKVDEQGRLINVLTQKLQDCGQGVDLTKDTGK